jgi:Acetyltransferase (GNAT) domain
MAKVWDRRIVSEASTGALVRRHNLLVRRYKHEDASNWTAFVRASSTGVFLFERPYMDYHSDRFADHSLLLYSNDSLVGVFPASETPGSIASHGGLTFGGLVCAPAARQTMTADAWLAIVDYYRMAGFTSILLKQLPWAFHQPLADDQTWPLWMMGATQARVDLNAIVDLLAPPAMQDRRLRSAKKALKHNVTIVEQTDFSVYWDQVLTPVLWEQHQQRPVHTLSEIRLLQSRFPERIRLFVALLEGHPVAGAVLYDYGSVLHTQYLAASLPAREVGALDLLIRTLVTNPPTRPRFISFGISSEEQGRALNVGLLDWKEGFGARAMPHIFWNIPLTPGGS